MHHSDRGVQYLSIRYTERLADEGAVTSVGSRGDSYDNAMAESINGALQEQSSSRCKARGAPSTTSSSPPSPGSTGGTTAGSSTPIGNIPPVEFEHHWTTTQTTEQAVNHDAIEGVLT